jgi:hypothetical protein
MARAPPKRMVVPQEVPFPMSNPPSETTTLNGVADLPPEAIEWARELVRQGYRDEHIVTFTESGYGLEHPIRCRPNLIGCILNEWLATQMAPDQDPGRYIMEWRNSGPIYKAHHE